MTWLMEILKIYLEDIFVLCVIDILSKYAWVIPLKDKKKLRLLMLFKRF